MLGFTNKLMAAGRSAIPLAKPLAIGGAIGIGLATILSEPPQVLDPNSTRAPRATMQSGTGGAEIGAGLHQTSSVSGRPTARNLVDAGNTARISGPGDLQRSHRIRIDGIGADQVDYDNLNGQIRRAVGGNTNINSSVRDNRSSLNPQKLADLLRKG